MKDGNFFRSKMSADAGRRLQRGLPLSEGQQYALLNPARTSALVDSLVMTGLVEIPMFLASLTPLGAIRHGVAAGLGAMARGAALGGGIAGGVNYSAQVSANIAEGGLSVDTISSPRTFLNVDMKSIAVSTAVGALAGGKAGIRPHAFNYQPGNYGRAFRNNFALGASAGVQKTFAYAAVSGNSELLRVCRRQVYLSHATMA